MGMSRTTLHQQQGTEALKINGAFFMLSVLFIGDVTRSTKIIPDSLLRMNLDTVADYWGNKFNS